MRQRGAQSRRRSGLDGGTFGAPLGSGGGREKFWPTVAMIAIVVATAGWTTVAVLALSGRGEASPSPSQFADVEPSDESLEPDLGTPEPESHVSPALEALLPKAWEGTAMSSQSVSGDTLLSDDDWSGVFTAFLTAQGRTPADLIFAQAYDPDGGIDLVIGAYKITGATSADVSKTVVDAWKASYPELVTTTVTVGGKSVSHGVIPDAGVDGYWYQHDDIVYEVETASAETAEKVFASLP